MRREKEKCIVETRHALSAVLGLTVGDPLAEGLAVFEVDHGVYLAGRRGGQGELLLFLAFVCGHRDRGRGRRDRCGGFYLGSNEIEDQRGLGEQLPECRRGLGAG
jgi:hypothetical protein